ncbi:MAG: AraC family transcriptional regulator [Pseudomonadota bacterium]
MTDVIPELLNMLRVRSTAYIGKNLYSPWGVKVTEHPSLARFHIVVAGSTWVELHDGSDPVQLNTGDVAIFFNGVPHSYMDAPGRYTQTASFPTGDEDSFFQDFDTETHDGHLLCGYFEMSHATPPAILSTLPDMLIGYASDGALSAQFTSIIELITAELTADPGKSLVVLNRLTELLCLYTIQSWIARAIPTDAQLMALSDPQTRLVLDAIHTQPSEDWSVDSLARLYGRSRTAFTTQFKRVTGMSPMTYVRRCRINKASQMLEQEAMSIDEIAFKTGYGDTNAFNRAFKRETGYSPGTYKRLAKKAVPK